MILAMKQVNLWSFLPGVFVRIKTTLTPTSSVRYNAIITDFLILFQYIIFINIITKKNELSRLQNLITQLSYLT